MDGWVSPKDIRFEDVTDPSFDVKTFGERAKMQGQYIAVPLEVPFLLTGLIQGARECETLDERTKTLLDRAGEVMALVITPNQPQRMAVIDHQGKKIRVPV